MAVTCGFALVLFALFVNRSSGHTFLTIPEPFSLIETCRIGGAFGFEADCPGPCPNHSFRDDKTPEMPSRTYKRGERVEIRWAKNNHQDGFMRISMVPIDEMWSKEAHSKYAFYFGCWTDGEFTCNEYERHRDCYYDMDGLGYKTDITIPTVYPDGVYVFGFSWYGGGKVFGSFGDYYDCAYVEIKGGVREDSFPATFESWDGYCMASVPRLGICDTEPCKTENWSRKRIPEEFNNGAPILRSWWYDEAMRRPENQVQVARHGDFGVYGLKIIDTNNDKQVDLNQDWVIYLGWNEKITLVPATFGKITYVQWYVNGKFEADSNRWPWSISGSSFQKGREDYYPWAFPYYDTRIHVTVVVWNGNRHAYFSKELVIMPKN